jgi:hypothetical protein
MTMWDFLTTPLCWEHSNRQIVLFCVIYVIATKIILLLCEPQDKFFLR